MAKVLVDTCIFIDIFRGNENLFQFLSNLSNTTINPIIFMELVQGARNKEELLKITKFLEKFEMILIDENISKKAMDLTVKYNLSHNLLLADAVIGATCIVRGLKLFTFNKKDFEYIEEIEFF